MAAKKKVAQLGVALLFAAMAALLTNLIYRERDRIIEWSWVKAHGRFDPAFDEARAAAARDFAEKKHPGQACVSKWLGKDDQFFYLALGCGRFEETLGEVKVFEGNANFVATRMRYSGESVQSMEQPHPEAYQNSLRRLFPQEAAEKLRNTDSLPEFLQMGLARMQKIRGI